MKTYDECKFSNADIYTLEFITDVVERMKLSNLGVNESGEIIKINCHIMAEAAAKVFDLELKRGHFVEGLEHSWLVTKNNDILDIYPGMLAGGPFLFKSNATYPNSPIYRVDPNAYIEKSKRSSHMNAVRIVEKDLRYTIKEYFRKDDFDKDYSWK